METIFKALFLTHLLLGVSTLNAQNFEWAKSIGSGDDDAANTITLDSSGNIYASGRFNGTVDFDPGPGITNLEGSDAFVLKLDSSENFLWARAFVGIRILSMAVDDLGNIYMSGTLNETSDIDPGPGTTILTGWNDIFAAKLDNQGNILWAHSFQGQNVDSGWDLAIDESGNMYFTGLFQLTIDFDPSPGTAFLTAAYLVSIGNTFEHVIVKLDPAGNFLWAKSFPGPDSIAYKMFSIHVSEGSIYTTGNFAGTVDFDPGPGITNLSSAGTWDIFVHKMDTEGNFLWVKKIGSNLEEYTFSIIVDFFGNVYTAGSFEGTVDFDPGSGTSNLISSGLDDIFVQKMDASGNFLWAKSFGGMSGDAAAVISIDASGSVYTAGYFKETVDFDPGPGTVNLTSAGFHDIFIQKMDASGNFLWAKSLGGTGVDYVKDIKILDSGNIYVAGFYEGVVDFDPGPAIANFTSTGGEDIFFLKLSQRAELDGYVFLDTNGNGIKNVGEIPIPIQTISYNNGNDAAITNDDGFFRAFPQLGDQILNLQLPIDYINTTPLSQIENVQIDVIDTVYFGVQPLSITNDLKVQIHSYTLPRPGFTRHYQLNYQNVGTTVLNDVTLKFLKPEEDNLVSSSGTYTVSGDTLIWNLGTLIPFSQGSFTITNTLASSTIPGGITNTQAWIAPTGDDDTPENNTVALNELIVGSYDPNDKTVTPETSLPTENEPLEYLVRFQNTGNYQADFVIVRDTLSTLLDLTSFQMIAASHNYELAIVNRIATWTFPQINLPDSTSDEAGSHGFIKFKVQRVDGLGLGTQIPNRVGIYFDYNAPVITNTCIYSIENCISTGTDIIAACSSYTWIDGNTYTSSNNTVTYTIDNAAGCDSIVTLNLTITNPTNTTDIQTACNSYTWIDGNTYNASNNTATYVIESAAGCDSIVTLNLTITNPTNAIDIQTACNSYTWIDGNTYNPSNNIATHTIANQAGCDSIVTLNLTIKQSSTGTDFQTACNSYTWIDGNTYNASNNIATHILNNAAGCDSIVTLSLTIHSVSNISTTLDGTTLNANNNNATYQWLDCDNNNEPIEGATSQIFSATEDGNYAVELTENGCTNTSACVAVNVIGIDEFNNSLQAKVYPNPTQGTVEITLYSAMKDVELMLTDVHGKVIFTRAYSTLFSTSIELPEEQGIYMLKLKAQGTTSTLKLVKE